MGFGKYPPMTGRAVTMNFVIANILETIEIYNFL
jgi:hypothetical protein